MTLDHTIRQAYINTLLDGGFTRLADGITNPIEGYIVGGVTEPTTMNLHTDKLKEVSVLTIAEFEEFKELWNQYEMLLHEHTSGKYGGGMGMGTWIHEGKIYFDLVQHMYNLDVATNIAKERGEIAIYDCKNKKDILL
jgi:hypothetical protein